MRQDLFPGPAYEATELLGRWIALHLQIPIEWVQFLPSLFHHIIHRFNKTQDGFPRKAQLNLASVHSFSTKATRNYLSSSQI